MAHETSPEQCLEVENTGLQQLLTQFETALQEAEVGWWDQNFVTGTVHRNDAWATMPGYNLGDICSETSAWKELVHPDDLPETEQKAKLHETGRSVIFTRLKMIEMEQKERIAVLEQSLKAAANLRGVVPICSNCKKIRHHQGVWTDLESYFQDYTEAEFSHGLCPHCVRNLYTDLPQK